MAYVYCHFKSDNNDPFYVGIGKTKTRPYTMYNRSKWHKNIVKKHGVRASIIINNIDWENACFWEKAWIKALKTDNYNIANLTDGGDGVKGLNFTEDHRKKLSDAKIGKKQSLETIKKRLEKNAIINKPNVKMVLTHNPLGEYGHIQHIKVSNVVLTVSKKPTYVFSYSTNDKRKSENNEICNLKKYYKSFFLILNMFQYLLAVRKINFLEKYLE